MISLKLIMCTTSWHSGEQRHFWMWWWRWRSARAWDQYQDQIKIKMVKINGLWNVFSDKRNLGSVSAVSDPHGAYIYVLNLKDTTKTLPSDRKIPIQLVPNSKMPFGVVEWPIGPSAMGHGMFSIFWKLQPRALRLPSLLGPNFFAQSLPGY